MKTILALADGKVFHGTAIGSPVDAEGEVVFNTSMSGYQEVLTDPSYCGQMVVMTYPLIGNYGINAEDNESIRPFLSAFIVKELSGIPSNWRSRQTLDEFLKEHNIPGIQGIDTRALTKHIRTHGAQMAVLSSQETDADKLVARAKQLQGLQGRDLVQQVTCKAPYDWVEGEWNLQTGYQKHETGETERPLEYFVVAYDFGVKLNILRMLTSAGCRVRVVPADTPWEEVLQMKPDGVFLSNGPGDPEPVTYAIENVKNLLGKVPIFGICLGHQILNLALGSKTFKLKFGHHGGNQPVMDLNRRCVEITSQNHNFAVDGDSVGQDVVVRSINLNDRTVEGIRHASYPVISIQYHPEASPGPHDASYIFDEFVELMRQTKAELTH